MDIPYSSLEMLTSPAQDKVFYRVDGPSGVMLTGYEHPADTAAVRRRDHLRRCQLWRHADPDRHAVPGDTDRGRSA